MFYCRWSTSARPSNTDAAQREVVTQADQKGASHVAVQPPAPVSQEKSVVSPSPQPEKHRQPQKGGSRHAPSELAPPNKSDRASQAQKGRADRPKATAPPVTKEEVRVIEAREIPSRHDDAPYGLEILFQTTVRLQPITLNVECSEPIQYVEVMPTQDFTGSFVYGAAPVPTAPKIAAVTLSEPAFVPEHAMVVRVYSKTKNQYKSFRYEAGHPH